MIAIIDGDVLVYMSIWGAETKEEAKQKFDELFTGILENLFTTDYVMALGGPDNFRVDLYSEYKANRSKSKSTRPDWFLDLKSDIEEDYDGCIFTDNCEADDMVRVWATECQENNLECIVVSVDKDLDCIPGQHYNPRTSKVYTVEEDFADYFYWKQVLMGDSTDNIPGLPGIGPKKAEVMLAGCKGHDERRDVVCNAYHLRYGDTGYEYLLTNGRLIHIWRKINDHFKVKREVYNDAIQE